MDPLTITENGGVVDTRRITDVQRHGSDDVSWAFMQCRPHPALVRDVVGYVGYAEHAIRPVRRREVPGARVPVIISFGDTIQVTGNAAAVRLASFVPGFNDEYAITEYTGAQRGLQVDLTPLGAFRLLHMTGDELYAGATDLADVLGPQTPGLVDRLACAPDWAARFGIMDELLLRRAGQARSVAPAIAWSWQRMHQSDGRVMVGDLISEIGWSRRHFVDRFRHHVGMGPKAAARTLRFARAARLLDGTRSISDVAADCGYADHSHLVREFRTLAGCTPSELVAERH